MTSWFRRNREDTPPPPPPEDDDSPDRLRRRLWELVQFINRNAGQLPVEAVVLARQVTDKIREVIETSADRDLDVYAVVQINGIVGDYLPTTLRAYLTLDPAITEQPGRSGRTPRAALREQLEGLNDAADELDAAARAHDVDALFSQGNFLRTKFTRSDLDL
jgi:predicted oxidoreductase